MKNYSIEGRIVDVVNREIFEGVLQIEDRKIQTIRKQKVSGTNYIVPGLVDAHIHIESSMLVPAEFARIAVTHGTVATVSDPHEIANVLGIEGVNFMIENSKTVPFKIFFGAPSCVPATAFESSGAEIGPEEIDRLLQRDEIKYLSEMMNYPGVLFADEGVMGKLKAARKCGKPVDGHAPGLKGEQAKKYVEAGISTDHECFTLEEAFEKMRYGMKVQIREGSAAKNFETLVPLLKDHSDKIMFCSDDKHPDDLIEGHINQLVKRAIFLGYDPVEVLRVCTYNPVRHYNLEVGLLQEGDPADFIMVDDLQNFRIIATYIDGEKVAENGKSLITTIPGKVPNIFNARPVSENDFIVKALSDKINVIQALEGQLITENLVGEAKIENGNVVSDVDRDILKIVVMNRYQPAVPAIGFISGFGLKKGALASTVAHDSHNIIAVGTNDIELSNAINMLIDSKGGISLTNGEEKLHLPLPVAGIMSNESGRTVADKYKKLNLASKDLGTSLHAPFMTLSFMALLVIPALKLSDKGLFDGSKFSFTPLFVA